MAWEYSLFLMVSWGWYYMAAFLFGTPTLLGKYLFIISTIGVWLVPLVLLVVLGANALYVAFVKVEKDSTRVLESMQK
jgi:hypothetical protein